MEDHETDQVPGKTSSEAVPLRSAQASLTIR